MRKFVLFLFAVALISLQSAFSAEPVKYIFLFIGDGLSIPQRMVAEEYSRLINGQGLLINALPVQGYSTTHCATQFITDSAASGTAIACGKKTFMGALGVDVEGKSIESIAETAKKVGKKVGIITTVQLNHATPAAFYAHNSSRGDSYNISLDMLKSNFDFFGGGTLTDLNGKKSPNSQGNIFELARKQGYTVTESKEAFKNLNTLPAIAISPRLQEGTIPYCIDSNPEDVTLADFTAKAIELLDNPNGFFIMVEGGKIDWVGHSNDIGSSVHETIGFDESVKVAYEFAKLHPEECLIVVTGDHETGGLTVGFAGTGYSSYIELIQNQKISVSEFQNIYSPFKKNEDADFDDLKPIITKYFGLKFDGAENDPMQVSALELKKLKEAFNRALNEGNYSDAESQAVLYGGYDPLMVSLCQMIANKAGVAWTSFAHTALPVGTSAFGKNADSFTGMTDNTDIANKIRPML